jgi:hypothetical protein
MSLLCAINYDQAPNAVLMNTINLVITIHVKYFMKYNTVFSLDIVNTRRHLCDIFLYVLKIYDIP